MEKEPRLRAFSTDRIRLYLGKGLGTTDRSQLEDAVLHYVALLADVAILERIPSTERCQETALFEAFKTRHRDLDLFTNQVVRDRVLLIYVNSFLVFQPLPFRKFWYRLEYILFHFLANMWPKMLVPGKEPVTVTQFHAALSMLEAGERKKRGIRFMPGNAPNLAYVTDDVRREVIEPCLHALRLETAVERNIASGKLHAAREENPRAQLLPYLIPILEEHLPKPMDTIIQRATRSMKLSRVRALPASPWYKLCSQLTGIGAYRGNVVVGDLAPVSLHAAESASSAGGRQLPPVDIEDIAKHLPPCIKKIVAEGRKSKYLKNDDRFYLCQFLTGLGVTSSDEALRFTFGPADSHVAKHALSLSKQFEVQLKSRFVGYCQPCTKRQYAKLSAGNVGHCPYEAAEQCFADASLPYSNANDSAVDFVRRSLEAGSKKVI